ncbi:MAG: TPM domain-containing protein [Candidatus Berkiellales bacterium]
MKKLKMVIIGFVILSFCTALFAANTHLQDIAGVISSDMSMKLETLAAGIEKKNKLYIEEVILADFAGKSPDLVINSYIDKLKLTSPTIPNKALLIIVVGEDYAHLFVSPSLNSIYTDKVKQDIVENVKLQIRQNNYDEMARVGIAGVYHFYETKPKGAKHPIMNIILIVVALIILAALFTLKRQKA